MLKPTKIDAHFPPGRSRRIGTCEIDWLGLRDRGKPYIVQVVRELKQFTHWKPPKFIHIMKEFVESIRGRSIKAVEPP